MKTTIGTIMTTLLLAGLAAASDAPALHTDSWEIVWTAGSINGLTHISAKQNDAGDIVMDIVKPVQDPPRRIIFYPPNGF